MLIYKKYCTPFFKGVIRSNISLGYVKVDSLEETLLFTQSKSDKIGRVQHTQKWFLSDFGWPEKPSKASSENNQTINFVNEKRVNQSDHGDLVGES